MKFGDRHWIDPHETARIRQEFREHRKSLGTGRLSEISLSILSGVLPALPSMLKGEGVADRYPILGLYRHLPDEIPTDPWVTVLMDAGFRLAYPRVDAASPWGLRYFLLPAPSPSLASWHMGGFGVREPAEGWAEVVPDSMLGVFIPGLAFGFEGERMGRGGGHYDRFLAACPGLVRVGVSPDSAVTSKVPMRPWDRYMDIVLTESRLIRVSHFEGFKSGMVSRTAFR